MLAAANGKALCKRAGGITIAAGKPAIGPGIKPDGRDVEEETGGKTDGVACATDTGAAMTGGVSPVGRRLKILNASGFGSFSGSWSTGTWVLLLLRGLMDVQALELSLLGDIMGC